MTRVTNAPRTQVSLDEPDEESGRTLDLPDRSPSAEENLVQRERLAAIRQRVQALPERQRIAVLMHKYQQMDYRQIAEVLKLSESATKSLLFRAYETLREQLQRICLESLLRKKEAVMKSNCRCEDIRELMPDLAAGLIAATPEVKAHLDSCAECAGKLEAFRQTMSLLDEWQAPEPSPYFDVRLNARLREEAATAKQPAGWLQWLRKPVLAASFALLMVASVTLVRMNSGRSSDSAEQCVASGGWCNPRPSRERQWVIYRRWIKTRICTPILKYSMISKYSRT